MNLRSVFELVEFVISCVGGNRDLIMNSQIGDFNTLLCRSSIMVLEEQANNRRPSAFSAYAASPNILRHNAVLLVLYYYLRHCYCLKVALMVFCVSGTENFVSILGPSDCSSIFYEPISLYIYTVYCSCEHNFFFHVL